MDGGETEIKCEEPEDNVSGAVSSLEEDSLPSDTSNIQVVNKSNKRKKHKGAASCKLQFKCTDAIKESHEQPIFGVQFNKYGNSSDIPTFATVGGNRASVYQCTDDGRIKLLQCYMDPDLEESFYTLTWTYDEGSGQALLVVAGARGIIRIISLSTMTCIKSLKGHGNAVNELKNHPNDPNLLLSASKDHGVRLWNMKTELCIVIFGGSDGHRDEVLSVDFNVEGTLLVSSGMDHSLKIWSLEKYCIIEAIKKSYSFTNDFRFDTVKCHFPEFTTRDIHRNYVDCARWHGRFVLSKSCENSIILWKTGSFWQDLTEVKHSDSTILHHFDFKDCQLWFMRFSLDLNQKMMALGNQYGRVYVWDLDIDEPAKVKCSILTNNKSCTAVRQTDFNKEGTILLYACDDSTVWRWDKINTV